MKDIRKSLNIDRFYANLWNVTFEKSSAAGVRLENKRELNIIP
jgi:hypothetical protein